MPTKQIRITEDVKNLLDKYPGKSYSQKIAAMVLCLETLEMFIVDNIVEGVIRRLTPSTEKNGMQPLRDRDPNR